MILIKSITKSIGTT